jgi:hypothetical protein
VKWSKVNGAYTYIDTNIYVLCSQTLSFMGVGALFECALLVLMVAVCCFGCKMGISNCWLFGIMLNIMRVYIIDICSFMFLYNSDIHNT